jgi:hypothetical protein
MKNKELWLNMISELKISEKYYDKILNYIEQHINFEQTNNIYFDFDNDNKPFTTLPLALEVFSKLGDYLNNINVVKLSNKLKTSVLNIDITSDICFQSPDLELTITTYFVDETVKKLKEFLKNNKINIYVLFSDKKKNNNIFSIFHRYYLTPNKN